VYGVEKITFKKSYVEKNTGLLIDTPSEMKVKAICEALSMGAFALFNNEPILEVMQYEANPWKG
jgi:hypothetical protein